MEPLEERKQKEIEHSRVRRSILQGSERQSDTNKVLEEKDLDKLIKDKEAFDYHFSNMKFYSITVTSEKYQNDWLKVKCNKNTKVLDFGCGNGENGITAAKFGAEVIGIDISPEGVENSNLNSEKAGVSSHCRFEVMDGENMTFEDNTFDLGVEYGVLHHVELNKTLAELSRVLKPNGEMICVEAIRHNPFIHLYRKMTRHLRTEWEVEHILGLQDVDLAFKYFNKIEIKFFHLAVLAAVPFRKTPLFNPIRKFLEKIDGLLLRSKMIGKYAWIMIFVLKEPKKNVSINE